MSLRHRGFATNHQSASTAGSSDFRGVSRLNNELLNTQRALAQHNAKLLSALGDLEAANKEVEGGRDELRRAHAELQESYRRLDQFAVVVSHDLRAPMWHVTLLAERLLARRATTLDEEARKWLDDILGEVRWAQRLVKDLLAYARVGTSDASPASVELTTVAGFVHDVFSLELSMTGGEFTWDEPLPCVNGDVTQLRQLVQNLVQNALSYRSDAPPCIHIGVAYEKDEYVLCVRDNGIGIAPEHHARVFEMLRRVHSFTDFSGSGVGLAICRQVVERHGGRIWVESTPGAGSAFFFTLPRTAPGWLVQESSVS